MEYIGRMAEILICIVCLTLAPAKSMLRSCENQRENMLQVQAERFYAGLLQSRTLTKEAYGHFQELVEGGGSTGNTFELMVARKYVMSAERAGGAEYGVPMKILYRAQLEEMLLKEGELALDGMVFVNISIYGGDGLLYSCGGGI